MQRNDSKTADFQRHKYAYHFGSPRSTAGVPTSFLSANGSSSSSSAESSWTGARAGTGRFSEDGFEAADGLGGAEGRGGCGGGAMLSSDTSGVSSTTGRPWAAKSALPFSVATVGVHKSLDLDPHNSQFRKLCERNSLRYKCACSASSSSESLSASMDRSSCS